MNSVTLSKSCVEVIDKGNEVELNFFALTEEDTMKLSLAISGNDHILTDSRLLEMVMERFEPDDIISIDSFEPSLSWDTWILRKKT